MIECIHCRGTGKTMEWTCPHCGGLKTVPEASDEAMKRAREFVARIHRMQDETRQGMSRLTFTEK